MLGKSDALTSRLSQLNDAHVAPLTEFVHELRARKGPDAAIPYFDPWDGGIDADVLFLLEAPGPKARDLGFVSRNNPDETARNFFELSREAGMDRKRTLTWNTVPWYIGDGTRIRPADSADVAEGAEPTDELIRLLPALRSIVLMGKRAQSSRSRLARAWPDMAFFSCPHPSPMFVNRKPGNRAEILTVLVEVQSFLDTGRRA